MPRETEVQDICGRIKPVGMGDSSVSQRDFKEIHELERGFAEVYRTRLRPRLDELQRQRNTAVQRTLLELAALIALAIFAGFIAWDYLGEDYLGPLVIGEALAASGGYMLVRRRSRGWRDRMFAIVMPEITGFIGNLDYSKGAPDPDFADAFHTRNLVGAHNRTDIEHHIAGTRRGTPFEVAQAHLEQVSRGRNNRRDTVFKGLLVRVRAPFSVSPMIHIARDYGGVLNRVAEVFTLGHRRNRERVVFDDAAFEDRFAVYSADADRARAIITPGLARALIAIDDEIGGQGRNAPLTAVFDGEWFYMAIPRRQDLLAMPSILRGEIDLEAAIHDIFADMTRLQRLIDRLHGH
jgi:hypothetical protein